MFKTYNINLAGQIFHINEDAFDLLSNYLQSLKKIYQNEEGGDEIIRDIEARISEIILIENKSDAKKVIDLQLVQNIIQTLGSPEQHTDISQEEPVFETKSTFEGAVSKKMFRDADNQIIAGVCSGLSQYLGINDSIWLRLLFLVSVFAGFGTGAIAYIVLWILLPEAKTASEKLQMRGEPINLENIEKMVKEGIQNVNNTIETKNLSGVAKGFGDFIKNIFKVLFKLVKAFVLFILIVVVVCIVFSLFIAGFSTIAVAPALAGFIFESTLLSYITIGALLVLFVVTALFLILLPFQIFSSEKKPLKKPVGVTIAVLWIGAFLIAALGSIDGVRQFSTVQKISVEDDIQNMTFGDTIIIESSGKDFPNSSFGVHLDKWKIVQDGVYNGFVELNIAQSPDSSFHIFKTLSARGANMTIANNNVRNIDYQYKQSGDTLIFNSFVDDNQENPKFRAQKVEITLYIPEGKTIIFRDIEDIIEKKPRIKNEEDIFYPFDNSTWKLEEGYLVSISNGITSENTTSGWTDITPSSDFKNIEMNGFLDAEIIYGAEYKVLVNRPNDVKINSMGHELSINMADKVVNAKSLKPDLKIRIYAPYLSNISLNGLTQTLIAGFNQESLKVDVDGSSKLKFDNNSLTFLTINADGLSKIGGSSLIQSADIELNGSGEFDGENIIFQKLNIELNGLSKAVVDVVREINGDVSDLSELSYKGKPILQLRTKGRGKITQI